MSIFSNTQWPTLMTALTQWKHNKIYLHDMYDIAARAAPRCMAVQHIAAFCRDASSREPDAANTFCNAC